MTRATRSGFRGFSLALAVAFLLSGCATQGLKARETFLRSLIGASEADLVREMGVPSRTFTANGTKFLAYDSRRIEVIPGFYGPGWFGPPFGPFGWPYGWSGPPTVITRGCQTTFEIKDGKVASFGLHGPGCG